MSERQDERLYQVTAPHFVAGLILRGDRCTDAAPILRWAVGMTRGDLRRYFTQRAWTVRQVKGR